MRHHDEQLEPAYGYLSVLESPEHGFFGGYLIISDWGRPLEFHCTAPVRPSRAQQILYGPSLRPYLLGEQIGPALAAKAKLAPQVILTDQAATLCLRSQSQVPMALVVGPIDTAPGMNAAVDSVASDTSFVPIIAPPLPPTLPTGQLIIANYKLVLPDAFRDDADRLAGLLAPLVAHVDLAEPFDRIHEAIREAQRIGTRGTEVHGQAA